jgi:hypothetical protein
MILENRRSLKFGDSDSEMPLAVDVMSKLYGTSSENYIVPEVAQSGERPGLALSYKLEISAVKSAISGHFPE